jgi:ubiquinone/menaquinone biosynthesis C-methylase UbiE
MFADPVKNLKQLGLRENMLVVDLGAGTGFYSIAAAKMVPHGKVYAIEIVRDYLPTIRNKAKEAHLSNLECLHGNIEKLGGTKLKDCLADVLIISNVLSQAEDREGFIAEAKRILKPGGKILLIDWTDNHTLAAPVQEKLILKEKALELFARKNISLEREIDAGSHHYGIVLASRK